MALHSLDVAARKRSGERLDRVFMLETVHSARDQWQENAMRCFPVRERPRSNRIGEAIYWVGWCHRQDGKPEEARKLYWETIEKHGDDPAIRSGQRIVRRRNLGVAIVPV